MQNFNRRLFVTAGSAWLGATAVLPGCAGADAPDSYEALAARTWRTATPGSLAGAALQQELVHCATLAPSSHNTQCWKFAMEDKAITVLPDLQRRCPAVDPDDHHLFVSLGCAAENLVQAARAHGLMAEPLFDATRGGVRVRLEPSRAQASPLYQAIAARQSTRADYDGKPLSSHELGLLQAAGTSDGVRVVMLTERSVIERTLEYIVQSNTAQMADPAFVRELRDWIRFSASEAARAGDGLYSASSGNPSIPSWVGNLAFRWVFTPDGENDKYARQVRSSAGLAVFVGAVEDKAHWVDVGRSYERFALQATALGIRTAFLNQPVEVAAIRPQFASAIGLAGQRPDLVVRFGRGPLLPVSLRRPVPSVLV